MLDLVLVVAILAAVGFGAYKLGNLVDNKSNEAGSESAGTTVGTTATRASAHHSDRPSRRTTEIVIIAIAGAAGVILLISLGGSIGRTRRRERWRSP